MSVQRRTLMGLAAVLAGAAGAGLAWWRHAPKVVLSEEEQAFWDAQLNDPQGQPLSLAAFHGRPLLVNFWATWCPPCVEELPLLNAFYDAHAARGWQVVGLAVDQPKAVQAFMQRLPLRFPVGMAGFGGVELSRTLGNPNGGLPYTVVFDAQGVVQHQKVGRVHQEDLDAWVGQI
ncbi:MAG TPA: TlpA disulfide reductase family protein [Hydrogenophaga sp.]